MCIRDSPNPTSGASYDVTAGTKFSDDGTTTVNGVSPTDDWGFSGVDSLYDTNANVALGVASSYKALYD